MKRGSVPDLAALRSALVQVLGFSASDANRAVTQDSEYDFAELREWREKLAMAWIPEMNSVGVNDMTGTVNVGVRATCYCR